jgi:glycerophosphoryl diester phosphodiesterase
MIGLMRPQRFRELGGLDGALKALAKAGLSEIAIRIECLEPDSPAQAQAAGLRLGAYGVNSDKEIRKALDADVTAFTTDFPDRALALRAELDAAP